MSLFAVIAQTGGDAKERLVVLFKCCKDITGISAETKMLEQLKTKENVTLRNT